MGLVGLMARYAQAAGATLLIARFSAWLAVAMLVGTLLYRRPHHRDNLELAMAFDGHLPSYRRARYLSGLVMEPPGAKETRVFGLADWILVRHGAVWREVTEAMSALRHRTHRRLAAYYLLVAPLHAVVFVMVGRAALDGRIDLGTLTVVLQASLTDDGIEQRWRRLEQFGVPVPLGVVQDGREESTDRLLGAGRPRAAEWRAVVVEGPAARRIRRAAPELQLRTARPS